MSNVIPPSNSAMDAEQRSILTRLNIISFAERSPILQEHRIIGTLGKSNNPVYRVRREADGMEFAMKVIRPASANEYEASKNEVLNTKAFAGNRHIVKVLDYNAVEYTALDSVQYAVVFLMPIYANYTREVMFQENGQNVHYLPWADMIREADVGAPLTVQILNRLYVARDIATALYDIDRQHHIHRDVKLHNIMCLPGPADPQNAHHLVNHTYLLGDFGEARGTHDQNMTHKTARPHGSPLWMSPEVFVHYAPSQYTAHLQAYKLAVSSDVYSLGLVLYALFTYWNPPFIGLNDRMLPIETLNDTAASAAQQLMAHQADLATVPVMLRCVISPSNWPPLALFEGRALSSGEAAIRSSIWRIIMNMCALQPDQRWSTQEVCSAINELISNILSGKLSASQDMNSTLANQTARSSQTLRTPDAPAEEAPVPKPEQPSRERRHTSRMATNQPVSYVDAIASIPLGDYEAETPVLTGSFQQEDDPFAQSFNQPFGQSFNQPFTQSFGQSSFLGSDQAAMEHPMFNSFEPIEMVQQQPPRRRRAVWPFIVLGIVLLLLLIGLGTLVVCSMSGDDEAEMSASGSTTSMMAGGPSADRAMDSITIMDSSTATPSPTAQPVVPAAAAITTATQAPAATPRVTTVPTQVPTATPTTVPTATPQPTPTPTTVPTATPRPTATPVPTTYPYDAGKTFRVNGTSRGAKFTLSLSLDEAERIDFIYINTASLTDGKGRTCGGDETKKFPKQFFGQTGPFVLGENVDAVSGATITSGEIVDLINQTIEQIKSGELR